MPQLYLVTDQGRRYAIPNAQELAWLGYAGAKPLRLPDTVVHRMPAGPGLDPGAAARPVPAS